MREEDFIRGKQKEHEFAAKLISSYGGEVNFACESDDMYKHIDLYWSKNNKTYSFDVKSVKRSSRATDYDDTIHWIEIYNVQGQLGWLLSEVQYIAFETFTEWIVVKRTTLRDFVYDKIMNTPQTGDKSSLYQLLQRWDRKDQILRVSTEDLRQLCTKIIYK